MSIDPEDVQQRFRAVAKHFPLWRFAVDLFFDVTSWQMIGSDITTMVVKNTNARRAANAMIGASPEALTALSAMAKVNEQRSNDVFRAIFLVTSRFLSPWRRCFRMPRPLS